MLFSAKAEYACLAMAELAARHADPKPVRVTAIAEKYGINHQFLAQILIQLNKAGLVASTRGPAGGYHLARPPAAVTLADVVDVIDGSDPPAARRPRADGPDSPPLAAALDDVWDKVGKAHRDFLTAQRTILRGTTLADLVDAGQGLQYVI